MRLRKSISALLIMLMVTTTVIGTTAESFAFAKFTSASPFSGVGYSKYYHNKDQFDGYTIKHGVDVSEYQYAPKCNYETAKKKGVDFAIIRVCWTGYRQDKHSYKNEDIYWKEHFKKAYNAGLDVGLYCFSQAKTTTEAKHEANYICDLFEAGVKEIYGSDNAKKYLTLPIYMDYEFAGGSDGRLYKIKKATATKCAKQFCETIKSRGYKPGIYASVSFLNSTIDGATLGQSYDIWAAQYYKMCEFTGKYSKWQYSSSAKISGIKNKNGDTCSVDVNYWYIKGEEPTPDPVTTAEPEKEKPVITPTTLKSLKGGKKKFTATWTKQSKSKVDGYQVQYSRFKDMSNDLHPKVTSYKTTSKTFKTNFNNYKYYVRIRTYKKIDGKNYYSKWSAKKTVKVK